MRITFSFCCLLALGLSGLGSRPKPASPDNTRGIFSIHSPENNLSQHTGQPIKTGFIHISPKPKNSFQSSGNLLDLSMLQLTNAEQNNGRGVERIRYIF